MLQETTAARFEHAGKRIYIENFNMAQLGDKQASRHIANWHDTLAQNLVADIDRGIFTQPDYTVLTACHVRGNDIVVRIEHATGLQAPPSGFRRALSYFQSRPPMLIDALKMEPRSNSFAGALGCKIGAEMGDPTRRGLATGLLSLIGALGGWVLRVLFGRQCLQAGPLELHEA